MQRQSLGSPGSKHHHAPGGGSVSSIEAPEDSKRLSAATSALPFKGEDDEEMRLPKSQKSTPTASKKTKKNKSSEKLIHGIPVLTLVCFLILYLSSHDPTQLELDVFGGLERAEVVIDRKNASKEDVSVFSKGRDMAAIRRQRKLRQIRDTQSRGFHRKFGDF